MTTKLPLIELRGPFWTLHAIAPEFGLDHVPGKKGLQEDRILPLRTLLLEAERTRLDGEEWRRPRLVSMHLLAGDLETYTKHHDEDEGERLTVALEEAHSLSSTRRTILGNKHPRFHTFDPSRPAKASFNHVVAEPILDGEGKWPRQGNDIVAPPFRLVAGAVELLVVAKEIEWLGKFLEQSPHVVIDDKDKLPAVLIRLTPDGIEIDAKVPFPGHGDLKGRFVMTRTSEVMRLRLLPDRLSEQGKASWKEAWAKVTPNNDVDGRAVLGLKIDARQDELPPAFAWRVELDDDEVEGLSPFVEVPGAAVDAQLLSPRDARGVDGEVTLKPDVYTLAPFIGKDQKGLPDSLADVAKEWKVASGISVLLVAELKPPRENGKEPPPASSRLRFDAEALATSATLLPAGAARTVAHRLAHDQIALAATLRRTYGFDDLRPGAPDPQRPMLAAFLPLDDGWLQLPVPNLPPPDITKDDIITPKSPVRSNVLAGYIRFAQAAGLPQVLSAFGTPISVQQAPWAITVEGAKGAALVVGIKAAAGRGTLVRAAVALDDPELSTRGLIWLSADRPDALEALPRLGAGAGAFLDIPLETFDIERESAVRFTLADLAVRVTREPDHESKPKPYAVVRTNLGITVDFDLESETGWKRIATTGLDALEKARAVLTGVTPEEAPDPDDIHPPLPFVRWQRHPHMPLAAAMPMTRGAASAVRPLESRDLVPFVIETKVKSKIVPLLRASWAASDVFPKLTDVAGKKPLPLRPLPAWPWPVPKDEAKEIAEHGIALAALGVPGAELGFSASTAAAENPWKDLSFALRYDLPALDEAFATATLPPQPGVLPEERELPPTLPTPVAYDWPAMQRFWDEQDRRHQLARVAHSYLVAGRSLGRHTNVPVPDLIGGAEWTTRVGYDDAKQNDDLPYGAAVVGERPEDIVTGNDALRGVSRGFKIPTGKVLEPQTGGPVRVTGYAPSSYEDGNEFLFDSRRYGVQQTIELGVKVDDQFDRKLLWRPIAIQHPPSEFDGLATLTEAVAADDFLFWFKDLPLVVEGAKGTFSALSGNIEFNVWQDGRLPLAGYEWRFVPPELHQSPVFIRGRDRVPFFGFELEPLRLLGCVVSMKDGTLDSAVIEGRLYLGPLRDGAMQDGNVVHLHFVRSGKGLTIKEVTTEGLRFVLEGNDDTRVEVTAGLGAWKNGPVFVDTRLTVTLFGADRSVAGATLTAKSDQVGIHWNSPAEERKPPAAGQGLVLVKCIHVVVTPSNVNVTVVREIALMPKTSVSASADSRAAALSIDLTNRDVDEVRLLGLTIPKDNVTYCELDGALSLTIARTSVDGKQLLPGFPVSGELTLGLGARVAALANVKGSLELTAGCLDAEIVGSAKETPRVRLLRVGFEAARGRRDEQNAAWIGAIRLHGLLALDNAIAWPGIKDGAKIEDVPYPAAKNGRTTIELEAGVSYLHSVEYVLDGHLMPFDLAARLRDVDANACWTAPVVATHTIRRDDKPVGSFTGVEAISIGSAQAIVPRIDDVKKDPLMFASRHHDFVKNGAAMGGNNTVPGMIKDFLGRMATVMRGALGHPFRLAFWDGGAKHAGLLLAGGFVGLLGARDGDAAPLLRLPILAALGDDPLLKPGSTAQNGMARIENVPWADGRAVRDVIATLRGAVAPASTSDNAIRAALIAGSRSAGERLHPEATVLAVLAEQNFIAPDAPPAGKLADAPFFIASAVSLARSLAPLGEPSTLVLSLLAGHLVQDQAGTSSAAAAVLTRNLRKSDPNAVPLPSGTPSLATIGDDVVVHPWTGPNVADLEGVIPVGLIAGPAFAKHVQPRVALLRTLQTESGRTQWQYTAPPLPRPFERARAAKAVPDAKRVFPDTGRGYALPPGVEPVHWLAGPEEGGTEPFRDDATSGLAGLSRVMSLPAHAFDVGGEVQPPNEGETNDPARLGLVWLAQTRAPVYLNLGLTGVKAPPIPWLTPGAPRPRNPAAVSLADAFAKLEIALKDDRLPNLQPVLPGEATLASVGDRAGISLARLTRLEAGLGRLAAFDGRYSRFGRPAQGGSWSVRTERTPRPGPLPRNADLAKPDRRAEADRRVCASAILPRVPLRALAGPADRVSGDANEFIGAWTVAFVAAREWEGMVTESWDGTVRLRAEVDVAKLKDDLNPPEKIANTLFRLLFPKSGDVLLARASLAIGDVVVPFVRMHVVSDLAKKFDAPVDGIRRGVVELVLDARPSDPSQSPGQAIGAIAAAFADARTLPPVEVRLVVQPESREKDGEAKPLSSLTVGAAHEVLLAEGDSRAPVTLRLPLAPVMRDRGALPLAPASLLFIDPAYDAGLGSAPAEDRARITPEISVGTLPAARGELALTLYADRERVNRRGTVTFMMDLAYERKADALSTLAIGKDADGDILSTEGTFLIAIAVVPKTGTRRTLFLGTTVSTPTVGLARVCEMSLKGLVEQSGAPAALIAGDMLEIEVAEAVAGGVKATLVGGSTTSQVSLTKLGTNKVSRRLRILLTDEPVVEPPSAVYAALVRRERAANDNVLSLPLYAQSPLPWRVDLRDAKRDFRRGLMRRSATFIWSLSRPKSEREHTTVFIVKSDRNGQTFLPKTKGELVDVAELP